jgi:Flp pilus assembly protein TadG
MTLLRTVSAFCNRLARERDGAVALLFGLMIIPLILAIGIGVDYARAAQFRAQLQGITDSAALAGAAAFVSCASQSAGTTAATNYFNNAKTNLMPNSGFTSGLTVTPGPTSCSSSTTTFTMTVTATTTVPTTLMSLYKSSIPITTTATASNPVVQASFNFNGFTSSACDLNTIYWYVLPSDGSLPTTANMNLMWANNTPTPTGSITVPIAASQKIGFALKNVTGGQCGYGSNQYGGAEGSTHYFYSQLTPPSSNAYSTVTTDCSLQVIKGTTSTTRGVTTTSFASPGTQCYSSSTSPTEASVLTYAAPSCSQLNGATYEYAWNDMGGTSDDKDYNDMVYQFSCSGGSSGSGNGTSTSTMTLTN